MGLDFDHNIDDIQRELKQLQHRLASELDDKLSTAMSLVEREAIMFVDADPHYEGGLRESIKLEKHPESLEYTVVAGGETAPYAAIVEYGSGPRSNISYDDAPQMGPVENPPAEYPFDAPDIDNVEGFTMFILEWMKDKPVPPERDSIRASAAAIARTIIERGNYAHPYLRPAWEKEERNVRRAGRRAVREAVDGMRWTDG